MFGFGLAILGAVAVVVAGVITTRLVTRTFGDSSRFSMMSAQGTGVVPSWVSLINLGGWALIVVGLIVGVVSVLA